MHFAAIREHIEQEFIPLEVFLTYIVDRYFCTNCVILVSNIKFMNKMLIPYQKINLQVAFNMQNCQRL